jgi:hypothetical protein
MLSHNAAAAVDAGACAPGSGAVASGTGAPLGEASERRAEERLGLTESEILALSCRETRLPYHEATLRLFADPDRRRVGGPIIRARVEAPLTHRCTSLMYPPISYWRCLSRSRCRRRSTRVGLMAGRIKRS